MKAQDLRIGMWVYLFGDAIQLTKEHLIYLLQKDGLPEPITLTEEWLLKFGFTKNPIAWHKDISYFPKAEFKTLCVTIGQGVLIRCGDLNKWREDDEIISLLNTDIQGPLMVHQLQNLYFALTGEELTLLK